MNENFKILIQNLRLIAINPEIYTKEGIKTMCEKAADLAEQVLEAGESLPYQDTGNPARDSEHNSVVDLCLPIHAKVKQELAELKALIESAKEELPAKKEVPDRYDTIDELGNPEDCYYEGVVRGKAKGFNEALSLCLPILAKYKMRVKELEEQLADWRFKF
jgi:hypothetical protein